MSWYGTHATFSKAYVRALLPARACRMTVYSVRVNLKYAVAAYVKAGANREEFARAFGDADACFRCGVLVDWYALAATAKLL